MQRLIKNIKRILRKSIFLIVLIFLIVVGTIIGIMLYNDLHGNEAKKYLIEKYGFVEKELFVKEYQPYVYEDVANCDTLWLKKCTDDKTLVAEYTFKTKNGSFIKVIENENLQYTDDYNEEPTKAWKEKEARRLEIEKQQEEQQKKDREAANQNIMQK